MELTNIGKSSRSYIATVAFYDHDVKIGTSYASFNELNSMETGRDTVYIPAGTTRYVIDNVAAIIGGKTYRVYYTQTS